LRGQCSAVQRQSCATRCCYPSRPIRSAPALSGLRRAEILLTSPRPTGAAQTHSPDGQWPDRGDRRHQTILLGPTATETAAFLHGDLVYRFRQFDVRSSRGLSLDGEPLSHPGEDLKRSICLRLNHWSWSK
jgi:hypothetical protein